MRKQFENMSDVERENCAILGGGCITIVLALLLLAIALLLCGCRSKRDVVREVTVIETHDSIHYVHDTLYFDVPVQTAQIVTHDSVSVLENDWAVSRVAINKDGTLLHKLESKPQSVPVPFEKPVETKTQVIYRNREVKVPMPVEKRLTKWQRTKMKLGGWLLAVLAAVLLGGAVYGIIKLRKLYR